MTHLLLADVGGTNTRLAHTTQTAPLRDLRRYPNDDFDSLEHLLQTYLEETGTTAPDTVCVAVAGPVNATGARLTNRPWQMREITLAHTLGARSAYLLNDLQAQAHALDHLPRSGLQTLRAGQATGGTRLVVGIGTGFNCAAVFETPQGCIVPAAEAGHATLAPASDPAFTLAHKLAAELELQTGRVTIEDLLSGPGLERAYRVTAGPHAAALPAKSIFAAAETGDPLAIETLRLFIPILGSTLSDLALTFLATGGLTLAGGVARACAPWLERMGFYPAFDNKGAFRNTVAPIPLTLITDDYAALTGARHAAQAFSSS